MYDITSRESFESIAEQVSSFIDYSPTNTARNILLVGNKADLAAEKRQVLFSDAERLARQMGLAGVLETSAKLGSSSLNDAFSITAVNAFDLIEEERGERVATKTKRQGGARGRLNSDQPVNQLSTATNRRTGHGQL